MSRRMQVIILAAAVFVAIAAYIAGHVEGASSERQAQRGRQLAANSEQLHAIVPKIERATAVNVTRQAASTAARIEYASARSQLELVDSTHAKIAGKLLELPAPVIQTVQRGDVRARRDSLSIVSAQAWGELWKAKAELLEVRVGLLEGQLADERRGRRLERVKDLVIAGVLGGALGVILSHD